MRQRQYKFLSKALKKHHLTKLETFNGLIFHEIKDNEDVDQVVCSIGQTGYNCEKCDKGYSGSFCSECEVKHWGKFCEPCDLTCVHKLCSDGIEGNGCPTSTIVSYYPVTSTIVSDISVFSNSIMIMFLCIGIMFLLLRFRKKCFKKMHK